MRKPNPARPTVKATRTCWSVMAISACVILNVPACKKKQDVGSNTASAPSAPSAEEKDLAAAAAQSLLPGKDSADPTRAKDGLPPIPGMTSDSGAPGARQAATMPKESAPPAPNCFSLTFRHKPMPSHKDEEACSQHQNMLRLPHPSGTRINAASVCIRVNGTPVRHKRSAERADEYVIGAVAGPKAVITARFCVGKASCGEPCSIPRDEFLEALGAGDAAEGEAPAARWEAADAGEGAARLDAEVRKELSELEAAGAESSVFREWVAEQDAPGCAAGTKVSALSGAGNR
jgi:hypothetical protein